MVLQERMVIIISSFIILHHIIITNLGQCLCFIVDLNNKIISFRMSTDNNLLTFLKKQSLFSNSPGKPNSRRNSRSRQRPQGQNNFNFVNQQPNVSLSPPRGVAFQANQNNQFVNQANFQNSPNRLQGGIIQNQQFYQSNVGGGNLQNGQAFQGGFGGGNVQNVQGSFGSTGGVVGTGNFSVNEATYRYEDRSQRNSNISNLSKEKNYAGSFQSARMETSQRLQDIANKVKVQINQLTLKIDMFSSEMTRFVSGQFTLVKQRIYQIVELALRGSEDYVREFVRMQQMKFTQEVIRAREALLMQVNAIEAMREDIEKPYWRNTAGVFITREFEAKVDLAISECQVIKTREVRFQQHHMLEMGRQLFDNVRQYLKREREATYGY